MAVWRSLALSQAQKDKCASPHSLVEDHDISLRAAGQNTECSGKIEWGEGHRQTLGDWNQNTVWEGDTDLVILRTEEEQ